jgi:hypothetical protein
MRQYYMVASSAGLGAESDCSGKGQKYVIVQINYTPVLSSGKAPHSKKPAIVKQKTKIWSWAPDGSPTPRQTGRLTVGRKLTSTSTSKLEDILRLYYMFSVNKVVYQLKVKNY